MEKTGEHQFWLLGTDGIAEQVRHTFEGFFPNSRVVSTSGGNVDVVALQLKDPRAYALLMANREGELISGYNAADLHPLAPYRDRTILVLPHTSTDGMIKMGKGGPVFVDATGKFGIGEYVFLEYLLPYLKIKTNGKR